MQETTISLSWRYSECTTNSASLLWIHYFSRFNYKSTIVFPNSLWIQYLYPDFLWIHYLFPKIHSEFIISISFSWIYSAFTINSANILWIHYLFSRIDYVFTIFCIESLWITFFFRENTIHPLSLSCIRNRSPKFTMNPREEFKFTIFFAK